MEVNNFVLVFGQGLVALLAFAFCALFYPLLFYSLWDLSIVLLQTSSSLQTLK